MIADLKERAMTTVRERAARAGRVPRRAYEHYFIEAEGLHSRVHLQNFWCVLFPERADAAVARISVFGPGGGALGEARRTVPPFGSLFLEVRELLAEIGADASEGTLTVDLEPPESVRGVLSELPKPLEAEIYTPYWMAYYDADENYMYVHSIERRSGTFGTTRPLAWALERVPPVREDWRSWRLLELESLSELQVVAINHGTTGGRSTIGLYEAESGEPIHETTCDFEPGQLHRVHIPGDEIAASAGSARLGRVGMSPLLTDNGKPYVIMRYGDGPLSLHHG